MFFNIISIANKYISETLMPESSVGKPKYLQEIGLQVCLYVFMYNHFGVSNNERVHLKNYTDLRL